MEGRKGRSQVDSHRAADPAFSRRRSSPFFLLRVFRLFFPAVLVPAGAVLRLFGLPQKRGSANVPQIPLQARMNFLEIRFVRLELRDNAVGPALLDGGGQGLGNLARCAHPYRPLNHRRGASSSFRAGIRYVMAPDQGNLGLLAGASSARAPRGPVGPTRLRLNATSRTLIAERSVAVATMLLLVALTPLGCINESN